MNIESRDRSILATPTSQPNSLDAIGTATGYSRHMNSPVRDLSPVFEFKPRFREISPISGFKPSLGHRLCSSGLQIEISIEESMEIFLFYRQGHPLGMIANASNVADNAFQRRQRVRPYTA
jgi:hypothetical protein